MSEPSSHGQHAEWEAEAWAQGEGLRTRQLPVASTFDTVVLRPVGRLPEPSTNKSILGAYHCLLCLSLLFSPLAPSFSSLLVLVLAVQCHNLRQETVYCTSPVFWSAFSAPRSYDFLAHGDTIVPPRWNAERRSLCPCSYQALWSKQPLRRTSFSCGAKLLLQFFTFASSAKGFRPIWKSKTRICTKRYPWHFVVKGFASALPRWEPARQKFVPRAVHGPYAGTEGRFNVAHRAFGQLSQSGLSWWTI